MPDIMHDILEGALQHEVKLMLKNMIEVNQYFSLDMHNLYNNSLLSLHYLDFTRSIQHKVEQH